MKKTLPVNISGKVYYIDEDAYDLLKNYLYQLRNAFPGDEGAEIVEDIENRISEHFEERIKAGAAVIIYADVNKVIETMGRPSDISDSDDYAAGNATGNTGATTDGGANTGTNDDYMTIRVKKHLYRNVDNKVFGGVISGLATYLGWDITIMRLLYVVLALVTYFWPFCIIYLILWMIIPPANTPLRVLGMKGSPVTVDNIGQTVLSATPPPYQGEPAMASGGGFASFLGTVVSVAAKCVMGFIGLVSAAFGVSMAVVFIVVMTGMIAYLSTGSIVILEHINFQLYDSVVTGCLAVMCVTLAMLIPAIALIWLACCTLFKVKSASKTLIITAVVSEILLISACIIFATICGISFLNL